MRLACLNDKDSDNERPALSVQEDDAAEVQSRRTNNGGLSVRESRRRPSVRTVRPPPPPPPAAAGVCCFLLFSLLPRTHAWGLGRRWCQGDGGTKNARKMRPACHCMKSRTA